jgi:signal transduction histidine kinase
MSVGVSRDITDREKLETVVRQREKMSAVGQLAAGIAHEINNPLTVALGLAQAMLSRMVHADPLRQAAVSIERETTRCKNLVQQLLLFARDRKPGIALDQPEDIVAGALSLVETQARVKKVELRRKFEKTLPPIQADRTLIQQVIINLCSNAIDAMPTGGVLTVTISREKKDVEIRVIDTGMGIPKEIQERVFEPFFTTKEVGKGTGLGLSLAYELVKKHLGRIDFESEEGKGTTFIIRLPAAELKASSDAQHRKAA